MSKSFIRYPGGKEKLKEEILQALRVENDVQYREPFFGGGSIGLEIISGKNSNDCWVNDRDVGIYALWTAVQHYPDSLKSMITSFVPSTDAFYEFKDYFLREPPTPISEQDIVRCGFKKLAIHQMSFSGMGVKSGGPLGGHLQKSKYKIDCRWKPISINKKITKIHHYMNNRNTLITNLDYSELVVATNPAVIYLDPPYFQKGGELYQHSFEESDHIKLAELLRNTTHDWVLSYDNCQEINDLYDWAHITEINMIYTISGVKTNKIELIITPEPYIHSQTGSQFICFEEFTLCNMDN